MNHEKRDRLAPVLILTAGTLWGSMGLFVRRLGSGGAGLSSVEIVQMRCIVAALLLFFYMLVRDRDALRIRLRDLWCFLGTGLCSIIFFNLCYFRTIQMTSLSIAAVLLYTAPAFVIALSAPLFG
ncbi:MAG: DMT family transporter, partial [Lachnospiraceae bacterium]|nr:DMT family transporter [Lachnospiraceae bacterium]